jgi:hypothetical protein
MVVEVVVLMQLEDNLVLLVVREVVALLALVQVDLQPQLDKVIQVAAVVLVTHQVQFRPAVVVLVVRVLLVQQIHP